jgi:hypothetical protein
LFARLFAVAMLAAVTAWPTAGVTESRPPIFTADRDAC